MSDNSQANFDMVRNDPNVAIAIALAKGAGEILLDRPADLQVQTKSTATDVVTEMDQRAEAFLVTELTKLCPQDSILGEEGANKAGSSGKQWVIDPLDGTVNYLHNLPHWCVSIGLVEESSRAGIAGVVYLPETGQMYISSRGLGAWELTANSHRKLQTSTCTDLSQALIATGFGYSVPRRVGQARVLNAVLPQIADIRRMGSCAIDLCYLADGIFDGYYERGVLPWDHAAGGLIAREAGAIVGGINGDLESEEIMVAATPGIHDQLVSILKINNADQD